MTSVLSDTQLAYIAGVIDVRGYMSYRQLPNDVVLPSVSVAFKSKALVERLCLYTGVKPIEFKRDYDRSNCGEHCPEPHVHVQSSWCRWIVTGAKCTTVLSACLPWLYVQRELAEQLIEAGREAPSKPATSRKMADLGWPALRSVKSA